MTIPPVLFLLGEPMEGADMLTEHAGAALCFTTLENCPIKGGGIVDVGAGAKVLPEEFPVPAPWLALASWIGGTT